VDALKRVHQPARLAGGVQAQRPGQQDQAAVVARQPQVDVEQRVAPAQKLMARSGAAEGLAGNRVDGGAQLGA